MSKLDDAIASAKKQMKMQKIPCNDELLTKIAKSLGPSLYSADAKLIAARDKKELATIKKDFLAKKLGETDERKQNAALAHAIEKIGPSNRHKLRSVFYYLIVKKLKKEAAMNIVDEADEDLWDKQNARRWELIRKDVESSLTKEEANELTQLEKLASAKIDQFESTYHPNASALQQAALRVQEDSPDSDEQN